MLGTEMIRPILAELAAIPADQSPIVNLFVDLPPGKLNAGRTSVRAALDQAHASLQAFEDSLDHATRMDTREALKDTEALLSDPTFARGGHGIAVFWSRPLKLHHATHLPYRSQSYGAVLPEVDLEQLVDRGVQKQWAVALIDRHYYRLLRGNGTGLKEVLRFEADLPSNGRDDHWQRHIEKHVDCAIENAWCEISTALTAAHLDHLLIVTSARLAKTVTRLAPSAIREMGAEHVIVDEDLMVVPSSNIWRRLAPQREALEAGRELRLVSKLVNSPSQILDIDPVCEALNERRVSRLVYRRDERADGVVCPDCGWLSRGLTECPADGSPMAARRNLLPSMLRSALRQGAAVDALTDRTLLDFPAGALLR